MNIERLLPETDLHVYKVTNVLTEAQVKLLTKLAEGKIPTGYKADEIKQAVADIRQSSIDICQEIFKIAPLQAAPENERWPWFDLPEGEFRELGSSGLFKEGSGNFFTEFFVKPSIAGGVVFEEAPDTTVNLASGEMLVFARWPRHDYEIKKIAGGERFTLLTHIHS